MKKTAAHSATSINNIENTQTLNLLQLGRAYFATGWRIIVPVILVTATGALCDARFGMRPWLTLLGLVVGFMVAGILVKRQGDSVSAPTKNHK